MSISKLVAFDSCTRTSISTDSGCVLPQVDLNQLYDLQGTLGRGRFARILLAKCRSTGTQIALKIVPKSNLTSRASLALDGVTTRDFIREFHASRFFSAHSSVVNTYSIVFYTTCNNLVLTQEVAPYGDLASCLPESGRLSQGAVKSIVQQIASALEFMHNNHFVHSNIKMENILVFESGICSTRRQQRHFDNVKLTDFGQTFESGCKIRKATSDTVYTSPEVVNVVLTEKHKITTAVDVWALGVLIYRLLIGQFPWSQCTVTDFAYVDFRQYQRGKRIQPPPGFTNFSDRMRRLLKRVFDERRSRRCGIGEFSKYCKDDWMVRPSSGSNSKRSSMVMDETLLTTTGLGSLMSKIFVDSEKINAKSPRKKRNSRSKSMESSIHVQQWLTEQAKIH